MRVEISLNRGVVEDDRGRVEVAFDSHWETIEAHIKKGFVSDWRKEASECVRQFACDLPRDDESQRLHGAIAALNRVIDSVPWIEVKR